MKIDVYAHVVPPRSRERLLAIFRARGDDRSRAHERALTIRDPTLHDLGARFRLMDELGSDYRQVLAMGDVSVIAYEPPNVARDLARVGNEELAGLVADYPDRFVGWVAQTALQDGARGLVAIEEAIGEGALGAQVFTSIEGRSLDHPDYEPFFALLARLDRPIWIHPNRQWSDFPLTEPEPRYLLYLMAGWPSDTAVAMSRLTYAGYLERWPDLRLIVHHSGGTVPMIAGRLKALDAAGPETMEVSARLTREPLEYLRRFYADTANFGNPIALRAALEFFGPEHVLFGTDFGFGPEFAPETIDDVETVIADHELRQMVYEDNTRRVLQLDEAALLS
jgi:aminocarboxymuconate-semialdehyde decarboxylase